MASDALPNTAATMDSSTSLFSLASDDNDAVNTDSARVYFGPIQSPEKKFAPVLGGVVHTPQVRRFTISSAAVANPDAQSDDDLSVGRDDAGVEPFERSREGTPVNELLPDEPSSALASRILQAHDNPSPPPSPLPLPEGPESTSVQAVGRPHAVVNSSESRTRGVASGSRVLEVPNMIRDPPPADAMGMGQSVSHMHRQQSSPDLNVSQQDLINFDSFSSPSRSPPATNSLFATPPTTQTPAHTTPERQALSTIDDLLSLSPIPSPSAPRISTDFDAEVPEITTASVDEEAQVLQDISEAVSPLSPQPPSASERLLIPELVEPHTPVRRSTRPRRSCSPFLLPTLVSDAAISAASGTPSVQQHLAVPTSLVIRKKPKGKGRDISLISETGGSVQEEEDVSNTGARDAAVSSRNTPVQPPIATSFDTENRGGHIEDASLLARKRTPAPKSHRLGSLSPGSTDVLMQLIPNSSGSGDSSTSSIPEVDTSAQIPALFPVSSSMLPTSDHSLQRIPGVPPTPSDLPDSNRSPARRIPIAQAIMQGTFSTHRRDTSSSSNTSKSTTPGPGVSLLGSPVFRRPALNDPTRSPAKRVPISQTVLSSPAKGKTPIRTTSPVRVVRREQERSGSAEPRPLTFRTERSGSAESAKPPSLNGKNSFFKKPASTGSMPSSSSAYTGIPKKGLPYPIVAGTSRVPTSIPEVEEGEPETRIGRATSLPPSSPPASSPSKFVSGLRQPSAGSRIPRIGMKPYARPNVAEPKASQNPKPPLVPRRAVGAASSSTGRPMRVVHVTSGSGSSSDEGGPQAAGPASTPVADNPAVASLKRKRNGEQSKASPPGAQPVVLIRKVVPGMFGHGGKTQPSPVNEAVREASPQKVQGRIRMRKVADWKRPPSDDVPSSETAPDTSKTSPPMRPESDSRIASSSSPSSVSKEVPAAGSSATSESNVAASASSSSTQPVPSDTRRSTRSRRHADPISDVFGAVAVAGARPLQPRRKRVLPEASAFAGMTALALKALTTTNTSRNQHHVVELQTEVIKKEGTRPESPTTRVRTVLERQKTIKSQERQARAERRARRSDGAVDDASGGEPEASHDIGDLSLMTVDQDGLPLRHRRGAGDEEDYETPPRPERPFKRGKFEDGVVEVKDEKRVKWDRGLATTVYLDDSPPKARRSKAETVKKGCLTPAAKTLRLDTLGNVLNADVPLSDIVHEHIVVKKFVYEDDPQPDDPAQETPRPPPVIKTPRHKTKKLKA